MAERNAQGGWDITDEEAQQVLGYMDECGDTLALYTMTIDQLQAIRRYCGVCVGHSPSWDGHDMNPPCQGAAREEIIRRARSYGI